MNFSFISSDSLERVKTQAVHTCCLVWMWTVPHRLVFECSISRWWHCLGSLWSFPDYRHPSRISHRVGEGGGLVLQVAAASGSSMNCLFPCPKFCSHAFKIWQSPVTGSLPEWPWLLYHALLITMDPNQRVYLPLSCFCLVFLPQGWEKLTRTQPEGDYDVRGYPSLLQSGGIVGAS